MELKTGDILHCSRKGVLASVIRFATKSKLNHTAIFIEIWGEPCIIEAQGNGVNIKTFESWVKKYGYKYEVSRSPKDFDVKKYSIHAMSKVGVTGYDFASLFFRQPFRLITGNYNVKKDETKKMYCSEYAMWTHGIEKSYRMSPQDVWIYCKNNNWIFLK